MFRHALGLLALVCPPASAVAQEHVPPASVVVAFDKETIRPLVVEGVANRETRRAVQANDPVRIASISKLIMALTALRLMDEGKLDLRRDVSDYLGWTLRSPHHPGAPVTLAHLLSHRAGLSDAAGYVIPMGESLEAKLSDPAAWRDTGASGEAGFHYANLGSPVIATVLEAASGERYDRLVERLIFAPLEVDACLNWIGCDTGMEARAVTLYRHTGEIAHDDPSDLPPNCTLPILPDAPCTLDAYIPGTNASIFSPQGGVRIGMVDLAKIGQALLFAEESGFLSPAALQLLVVPPFDPGEPVAGFCAYGLGIYSQTDAAPCANSLFDDETTYVGHGGEAYGLQSGLWLARTGKTSFAYFTTAVPQPSSKDTGSFSRQEIDLIALAQELLAHER